MDHCFDGSFMRHSDKSWLSQEGTGWCSLVGVHKLVAKEALAWMTLKLMDVTDPGRAIEKPVKEGLPEARPCGSLMMSSDQT